MMKYVYFCQVPEAKSKPFVGRSDDSDRLSRPDPQGPRSCDSAMEPRVVIGAVGLYPVDHLRNLLWGKKGDNTPLQTIATGGVRSVKCAHCIDTRD